MKEKTSNSKLWILILLLFPLITLWLLQINFRQMKDSKKMIELHYFSDYVAQPITMDLWESEMYFAAIPIQQMLAGLTFYSNYGRYELRLAESWKKIDSKTWVFKLRDNIKDELGEEINSFSFKRSLERTLLVLSDHGDTPVLKYLKGYNEFIKKNKPIQMSKIISLDGIIADSDNNLIFKFDVPVRDGVLQILSFPSCNYVSAYNFNEDGSWKDPTKFISSGPYQLSHIELGKKIVLKKRLDFALPFSSTSPDTITFYQGIDGLMINSLSTKHAVIADSFKDIDITNLSLNPYQIVPEFISGLALGNLDTGFFSNINYRHIFKSKYMQLRDRFTNATGIKLSNSLYPDQDNNRKEVLKNSLGDLKPQKPLIIRGKVPNANSRRWQEWLVLKDTLDFFNLKYTFSNTDFSRDDTTNKDYDIRLVSPSVGGGLQPWIAEVLFCSKLNAALPDPNNTVCNLITDYNSDRISDVQFSEMFFSALDVESAFFPLYHFGLKFYINNNIVKSSISPMLSVLRIDQMEISQ